MPEKEEKYELNEEVAKGYTFVKGAPPVFEHLEYGTIDIRTVSTETVEGLIKAGVPYFKAKAGNRPVQA